MRLSEKPTIEESLILAHLQAIGIAHRAIVALLGDRHAFQEDELLPEPKMVIYLKTITEEAAKIEEIVNEHPVLNAFRDGYAEALKWVLSFGLDPNVEDSIKEALDS